HSGQTHAFLLYPTNQMDWLYASILYEAYDLKTNRLADFLPAVQVDLEEVSGPTVRLASTFADSSGFSRFLVPTDRSLEFCLKFVLNDANHLIVMHDERNPDPEPAYLRTPFFAYPATGGVLVVLSINPRSD